MLNRQVLSDLKTFLYRKPKEQLTRLSRIGAVAYFGERSWMQSMEKAAAEICNARPRLVASESAQPLSVWFLTGTRFWYQSFFCAYSLALASQRRITVGLVDDGTLTPGQNCLFRQVFPHGKTIWRSEVAESIDTMIPRQSHPTLRQRWDDYVNIRKLTDIHLCDPGRKLVLDSDMLFFNRPNELLDWYDSGASTVLFMKDCVESYGYSRGLMTNLCGAEIPVALNVGVCGLESSLIDWTEIEHWCHTFQTMEGTSYFLEQAICAMLGARRGATVLSSDNYIVLPTEHQVTNRIGVLQHYVADSKIYYFRDAWKKFS